MAQTPIASSETSGRGANFLRWCKRNWKGIAGAFLLLVIIGVGAFFALPSQRGIPYRVAEETYTLVRDKISSSAAIALALPKGVEMTAAEAQAKVTFEPPLEGSWTAGSEKGELFFEPEDKLTLGSYYTVSLETPDGILSKDFLIDEDPKILSIFPRAKSEAPENSEITIVFNRPMVPLTTLDELDQRDVPVKITPPTKGKFKWISTRNLQFIPEKRLVRSANYTVGVGEGLRSVDGLPLKGATHTFITRPLRYGDSFDGPSGGGAPSPYSPGEEDFMIVGDELTSPPPPPPGEILMLGSPAEPVLHNQPFTLTFNQPVDLARTKSEIKVMGARGQLLPVIVEYGTRTLFDEQSEEEKTYTDTSVLAIYNAADRNGRPRFWDFNSTYSVSAQKAFPLEGDIILDEKRSYFFSVPEVIAEISAKSPRSMLVTPDVFDPMGELLVRFHEEIDKGATSISAPHLASIKYGEKCAEDEYGNAVYLGTDCEKVEDKTLLSLSFDKDAFGNSEEITIEFKKIVNVRGVSLIGKPLLRSAKTYPKLAIRKTSPETGTKGAKLTELRICSNTPIKAPEEAEFYRKVTSNLTIGRWNWSGPHKVEVPYPGSPCVAGEFESALYYGLIPESAYALNLSLEDDFGQSIQRQLSFTSGKIDEMYRRFTHLQKVYNVTSPERTKLVFGAENLEYLNLHICKVDPTVMMRYLSSEGMPGATVSGESLSCAESFTRRIELPKRYFTPNFFELNLREYVPKPLGHYILTFSHPEYRRNVYNPRTGVSATNALAYERSFLTVTNLAVQEKKIESDEYREDALPTLTTKVQTEYKGNLYWITSFGTLEPVVGARVDIYGKGGGWLSGGTSDAEGIARTPVALGARAAIVTSGGDSAIVSSEMDKFQWAASLASAERTYIYTDRPIYRPAEEVFIKGIYRVGYDGAYEIVRNKKATLEIFDGRGEKQTTIVADISPNGTFTGKLRLPKNAPLGMYRIEALGGYGFFEVEEYAPSAFEVHLSSAKDEYIAGEKLEVTVDAAYYFGVPLEAGDSVEYSLLAQDYYFDRYSDGWFQFGRGWYYGGSGGYGDRFLLRGRTVLNGKGEATIQEALDFEKLFKATGQDEGGNLRSKIFTVNVTVKNKQGQTVSGHKSFIVHRGAFYLGANLEHRYFGKDEQNKILVKSVDTEGAPTPVGGIDATIYRVTWESFKRQEVDGRFYYRSERKREPLRTFGLRTNAEGEDEKAFSLAEAGEYELEVSAKDKEGNPVISVLDFYIYGEGVASVRPTNNETLELSVDRNTLKVGETANVVIKSPFERGKALVTIERGKIFEYQIVDVRQNLLNIGIPIKEHYLPNIYFSVILLSERPEVKYGQVEFNISTAEKELTIDIRSDKKSYLPGEKVRLSVTTKDAGGRPVPAEVSIAVADMSVLALKGNPKKDPVAFFYAGFPLGVSTASNVKNILHEAEVPKGTKGGGGGDGDLSRKKRGDFKSTALWQGVLETGSEGTAEITFTLPDNLTTWQSEAVGVTKDTKVGVGYSELVARKEVMVTPLKPRFIVPGDSFKLGATVFNESDRAIRFNIKVESPTLVLTGAKNAFEKIDAGGSRAVYFDALAPEAQDSGAHSFTLSAEGGDLLDIVEDTIAIKKNDTYESVATSFSTSKERAREYVFLPENVAPDKGALTITVSSTLAMYLSDALQYLISFPYGCSEQIASKLSTIALLKRAHTAKGTLQEFKNTAVTMGQESYHPDELIEIGLARIYSNEAVDGGFTYYPGGTPNFYLTMHILNTLIDLRTAGYAVREDVLTKAARYVANGALYDDTLRRDSDATILAAHTLERVAKLGGGANPLREPLMRIAGNRRFVRETGSNLSLGLLALTLSGNAYDPGLRNEVLATLENRLTVDSRGAFLKVSDRRVLYDYYETPIKDTALLLRSWVAVSKEHELTEKVLRWLLKSRSKDGSWGSTNSTLAALEALTEYEEWKKEANSNFELGVFLDDGEKAKWTLGGSKKEELPTLRVPVSDISKGSLHTIDFVKKNLNALANTFYYDLSLTYFLPIQAIPPRDEGFAVERSLYALADKEFSRPVTEARIGEVLKGILRITVPKERRFVAVENFIPAGTELINFNLSTEDQSLQDGMLPPPPAFGRGLGVESRKGLAALLPLPGDGEELPDAIYSGPLPSYERLYADAQEVRDDRLFLFRERLPAGVYEYEYFIRALVPGKYQHLPAVVSELYFPENFGRTRGDYFTVTQ